jgi:hypothetical protein
MEYPYNVMGGMQDNGAWMGPSQLLKNGGIRNGYWERIVGGDGFDVVPDPTDFRYGYSLSQGANIQRYDRVTGEMTGIRPEHPNGEYLRWNWNAGVNVNPIDKNTLYLGAQYLFKSTDQGKNWQIISPDLTTNDPEKQKQIDTGGLNYDNTGAEKHTTITVVEPSAVKQGIIWVGTDDGNVQLTQDGGGKWVNSTGKFDGLPEATWVQQIKSSTYDASTAVVVFDDHRRNNWEPYVYQTTNYGKSWKRIVEKEDVFGFALSFVQDPIEPNLMFLGTEGGLYVSMDGSATWEKWTHGYPTVPTMDLQIHPREHDLIIGTFGRALWILDDIRPLREATQMGMKKLMAENLHLFPIPDATNAIIGQYMGYRSTGDGLFMGENKPFSAAMNYYSKEEGKVKIEISDAQGKVMRTLYESADKGLNRIYWGFEGDGVRQPGARPNTKEGVAPPRGYDVLPGTYTVEMTKSGASTSQMIKVMKDPRSPAWDMNEINAKQKFIQEYYDFLAPVVQAIDRLQSAIKSVDLVGAFADDNAALKARNMEIKKELIGLNELIYSKSAQGSRNDPNVLSRYLGNVRGKIGGSYEPVTQSQRYALANAQKKAEEVIGKMNDFFNNDWPA